MKVYQSAPTNFKDFSKPDPSNRAGVYPIFCECGKQDGETGRNLPTRLKEQRAHGRRGNFEKSAIMKHSHKGPPNRLAMQLNSSHPSTRGIPDASERPSRYSSTILFHGHRFLHRFLQRYLATPTTDRRIFYIHNPPQTDKGIYHQTQSVALNKYPVILLSIILNATKSHWAIVLKCKNGNFIPDVPVRCQEYFIL